MTRRRLRDSVPAAPAQAPARPLTWVPCCRVTAHRTRRVKTSVLSRLPWVDVTAQLSPARPQGREQAGCRLTEAGPSPRLGLPAPHLERRGAPAGFWSCPRSRPELKTTPWGPSGWTVPGEGHRQAPPPHRPWRGASALASGRNSHVSPGNFARGLGTRGYLLSGTAHRSNYSTWSPAGVTW